MLDRCLRIQRLIDGLDFEAFAKEEPVRVTVAHYLQDMGEAARRVSSAFQGAHAEVPALVEVLRPLAADEEPH